MYTISYHEGRPEPTQSLYTNISSTVDTDSHDPQNVGINVQRDTIENFLNCFLCTPLAFLGVLTNLTNLGVLAKQGLTDSVNISLFALAFCDLTYVITVLAVNQFCFVDSSDPLVAWNIGQMVIPHGVLTRFAIARISSGLMALISVERALSVLTPLHFRKLVTRRCTAVAVAAIYIFVGVIFVPAWMMMEVKWFSVGGRLAAVAVFTKFYLDNVVVFDVFNNVVNSIFLHFVILALVATSTFLTIVRLKLTSRWRQTASSSFAAFASASTSAHPARGNTSQLTVQTPPSQQFLKMESHGAHFSSKLRTSHLKTKPEKTMITTSCLDEKTAKLTKLLVTISIIYIICLIPGVTAAFVRFFLPEHRLYGRYHKYAAAVYALDFLLETFNATVTFFVYVTMSSRFRMVLKSLLPRQCCSATTTLPWRKQTLADKM